MLDMAMQEMFFSMMSGMMKELMPGGNFQCEFSICDFSEKIYTSVINSYYGNFEITFDNGEDASDFVVIAPSPSNLDIPDPEGDFTTDQVPMTTVQAIPLEIGSEAYISVNEEKLRDWLTDYEVYGKINFKMESVYPMEF